MSLRATLGAALVALVLAPACSAPKVVRVVAGRPVEGRYVSPRAYAYYARGAEAEARGDLAGALHAYEGAARDDDGAEPLTRVGAVRCVLLGADGDGVVDAWRRAEAADPAYAPLWRERARCDLGAGRFAVALAAAERAVALDPDDVDASIVLAAALERSGRFEESARVLEGDVVRFPAAAAAWRALRDFANRRGDADRAARANIALQRLAPLPPSPVDAATARAALDAAIRRDDGDAVRRLAVAARLPLADVAVRAVALDRPSLARALAGVVLGADPRDASARVAVAAAADLRGDVDALDRAGVDLLASPASPTSPLAALVLAELLARRVGEAPARAVFDAVSPPSDADPLFDLVARRLRRRFGLA